MEKVANEYEIVLVNDASPDGAWDTIVELATEDRRIVGINLSRNFGQHNAITAGLDWVNGTWVVVMDCDLQDVPEEIELLYKTVRKGYDIVFARRISRKDSFFKRLSSEIFHRIYGYFIDQQSDSTIANFCILSNNVVKAFRNMREQSRSFPAFVKWLGFKVATVDIEHSDRLHGKSSYNLKKMTKLAIDSIVSQSNKPLRISIIFGFTLSFGAFSYAIYRIYMYAKWGVSVEGWTSVIVSIYFLSGILMANIGILGLYIGKIYNETKKRPIYVIKEVIE